MSHALRLASTPFCRRVPGHLVQPLRSRPAGISTSRTFATAAVLRYAQQDGPPPTTSSTSAEAKAPSSPPKSLFQRLNEPEPETAPAGTPAGKEKGSIELHENIYTIPNLLTVSRILACPALGYFIVKGDFVLATGLLVYAGTTDFVRCVLPRVWQSSDGHAPGAVDRWLARAEVQYGLRLRQHPRPCCRQGSHDDTNDSTRYQGSPARSVHLLGLSTASKLGQLTPGHFPVSLAVLILGRDVALSISAFYFRYISLPEPVRHDARPASKFGVLTLAMPQKTFKRYWDFSIPSAEVKPTQISKVSGCSNWTEPQLRRLQ